MTQASNERVVVIDIEGKLNGETAIALETNINSLLNSDKKQILLNCELLNFVTSSGIGFLLSFTATVAKSGGVMTIIAINNEISSLFSLLNISKFLNIFPTKQDAVESIKESLFSSSALEINEEQLIEKSDSRIEISESNSNDFTSPIIIECNNCRALVRVYRPGDYICPSCKTEFNVTMDGTAIF